MKSEVDRAMIAGQLQLTRPALIPWVVRVTAFAGFCAALIAPSVIRSFVPPRSVGDFFAVLAGGIFGTLLLVYVACRSLHRGATLAWGSTLSAAAFVVALRTMTIVERLRAGIRLVDLLMADPLLTALSAVSLVLVALLLCPSVVSWFAKATRLKGMKTDELRKLGTRQTAAGPLRMLTRWPD